MSSVMRPSGPLPPRVYWTRRLLALVVLVVVISILWWCVQKVTGSADESASSSDPGGPSQTPTAGADSTDAEPEVPTTTNDTSAVPDDTAKQKPRKHKKNAPLLAPTGGCDVTAVAMAIKVDDVDEGKTNPIKLQLTGPRGTACTQAITPTSLVLRITSGDDIVWSSDDCPDELLAEEVVVRADPPGTYTFDWDGRRSTGSCAGVGAHAKPGGYWVEAALIGADAHKAYFDVRA